MIRPLLSVNSADSNFFRIYAMPLPDEKAIETRRRHAIEHFLTYNMVSSVLQEFYGISHSFLLRDEQGKPQLIHPFLHINMAHCRGLAVCAVSSQPIGVDAEPPRKFRASALKSVCTTLEQQQIQSSKDETAMFSRIWTLKEAYGKWHGGGIRLPLADIPFSLSEAKISFLHADADNFSFYQGIMQLNDIPYSISVCTGHLFNCTVSHEFTHFYTS